jgi:hypothetical protein
VESRYLTWIRNHANYMAVRGWSDYFRAVGVLISGAFVNFLVLLPVLLVIAVPVAGLTVYSTNHRGEVDVPYFLTFVLLAAAFVIFLSFPARSLLARIAGYRQSQDTGTDSSVKERDRRERRVGALLALVVAAAAFDSLVWLLAQFHGWLSPENDRHLGVLLTAAVGLFGSADKILSKVPMAAKTATAAAVAALGLVVPVLVILWVADWLCYQRPDGHLHDYWRFLALVAWLPAAILLFGLIIGAAKQAFSLKGVLVMLLLLGGAVGFACLVHVASQKLPGALPEPLDPKSALHTYFPAKALLTLEVALVLWGFCWLTVDVNLTSIHGLYRDRLASTFLVGADTEGDVDIEEDIDLGELSCHEAGSTAPYHLINVALNLQGSSDITVRDRRSDFFVFSKRFIGGDRTGYCESQHMERVFPHMSLASAMAISAAAASPNMGRETRPALVALMTVLNIRLGVWVPNPGFLQRAFGRAPSTSGSAARSVRPGRGEARGLAFAQVFAQELGEIERRWGQLPRPTERRLAGGCRPSVEHGLVGVGLSGGGIRSAAVSLGILQALDHRGVFEHVDYLSTVSGGGYVGSSISALMRQRTRTVSEVAGRVSVRKEPGSVVVSVAPEKARSWLPQRRRPRAHEPREYRYSDDARLAVESGERVKVGQRLLLATEPDAPSEGVWRKHWRRRSFDEAFGWRVPPKALLWELMGWLDETRRWVNVSDGGHIENLGAIELLRRRCQYLILCDGEEDRDHRFGGLATLIRTARLDLGIRIDIDVNELRTRDGSTRQHWATGRITYPSRPGESDQAGEERGYLLYLKSSVTGDEDEVIREYRARHPEFPHQATADQMFDEAQFEAYRSLGQHIAEEPLGLLEASSDVTTFAEFSRWLTALGRSDSRPANDAATRLSGPVSGHDERGLAAVSGASFAG